MIGKVYSLIRNFLLLSASRCVGEPLFFQMGMRKGRPLEPGNVQRVLIVKLDEIGDAVLTTPLVRELRANLPDAWITLIVKPQLKELWETCPYINELITYDRQTGPPSMGSLVKAFSFARKRLWQREFDLAIVPRWDADYYGAAFLAYFSGAPERLGYSSRAIRGGGQHFNYDRLYTNRLNSGDPQTHEVLKNIEMLNIFFKKEVRDTGLELWLTDADTAFADAINVDGRLKLAYGIGAASEKRIWPMGKFIELIGRLKKQGLAVVILGGERERAAGEKLVQEFGDMVINLAGRTTLRQAAAVLKKCAVYVGSDSGLMHIAAGVGTPVVEISCHPLNGYAGHYNSPCRFGPWGVRNTVLQPERAAASCLDACEVAQAHCIKMVSVDAVLKAIAEFIE